MFKKLFATLAIFALGVMTFGTVGASLAVDDGDRSETSIVSSILGIEQTSAYTFSSTGGIEIETADVNEVTDSALIGVASFFQILKFVGLAILIGVSVFIVNKIFSIAKVGS